MLPAKAGCFKSYVYEDTDFIPLTLTTLFFLKHRAMVIIGLYERMYFPNLGTNLKLIVSGALVWLSQ